LCGSDRTGHIRKSFRDGLKGPAGQVLYKVYRQMDR
jgi:hypothetical protein